MCCLFHYTRFQIFARNLIISIDSSKRLFLGSGCVVLGWYNSVVSSQFINFSNFDFCFYMFHFLHLMPTYKIVSHVRVVGTG